MIEETKRYNFDRKYFFKFLRKLIITTRPLFRRSYLKKFKNLFNKLKNMIKKKLLMINQKYLKNCT